MIKASKRRFGLNRRTFVSHDHFLNVTPPCFFFFFSLKINICIHNQRFICTFKVVVLLLWFNVLIDISTICVCVFCHTFKQNF